MIVAISGTPGTGKTETADRLGRLLGWRVLHLNAIAESKGLYIGFDKKRGCKVVDLGGLEEEVKKESARHGNLIIEAHYAHELEADVVIILRCDPGELRRRLERKGWKKEKIDENVEAEIMEVCRQEALELGRAVLDVDTTGRKISEVVAEVAAMLGVACGRHKRI